VSLLTDKDRIIEAIITHPERARKIWIESGYERALNEIIIHAKEQWVSFRVLPKEIFAKKFKEVKSHVCLEKEEHGFEDPQTLLKEIPHQENLFICVFDGIYDPQNLGNIIRSAACLEVDALVLPKDKSCGITETVLRISKGALEHVRIVKVVNVARFLDEIKKLGVFCYALDEKGEVPLWSADLKGRICLVFGSEDGLRRLTKEKCDGILAIPTCGRFMSLNIASCFALCAYEVKRQREKKVT